MNTDEWMIQNGIDWWLLSHRQADPWFRCRQDGCDGRPFAVKDSELEEAGGWIACEFCGQPCEPCDEMKR